MSFWSEMKRRNVYKVAVAYAIVAWLILQVASITFPALNLPSWALTLLTVFIIVGFPLVLLFAWAFEITPEGLRLTKDVPKDESITHVTGRKLDYILGGLLLIAVAYILFDNFYLDKLAIQTEVASRVAELVPPAVEEDEALPSTSSIGEEDALKTIAVLPFDDLSPENDQEYFVLGLSEEILNSLAQISDLTVIAKTSSFSFKDKDKTIQEIVGILGVENILEGSVRKAGNALRITAQLVKGVDGSHIWSKTYDRELKDTFAVQEDIATAIAGQLKITLGIDDSIKILGGTDNQEAYELYMTALGGLQAARTIQGFSEAFNRARSSINTAIELDPHFALAWSLKSTIHWFNNNEADQSLRAAQRAIELQPSLPDGYSALGDIERSTGEFIDAALAYEKALELSGGAEGIFGYASLLHDVAYFEKAHELIKEARLVDPLNPFIGSAYLENLGLLGDAEQAEKENERLMALFGHDWWGNFLITNVRLGSGLPVTRDQIVSGEGPSPISEAAKEYLETPKEGLVELHRFYNDKDYQDAAVLTSIAFWAAYFGDFEFAMDSIEKAISIDKDNIKNYWYPLFKDLRKLPRFKKILKEIGLVDYWEKFGWPDLCHPTDDGDFVCD